MKTILKLLSVLGLVVLTASHTGCLLVAAGAATGATVAYVSGDLNTSIDASPKQVAAATEAAMAKLDIAVISTDASKVDAKIVGRTARDTRLTVVVKSTTADVSELSVRAGRFGDDALQARLLEEIRTQLNPGAATAKAPSTQPALAGDAN